MNLAIDSDIYEPTIMDDGNYSDYLPPSSKFKNGMRCPCGTRKDHVFDSRQSFGTHIKSKTHKKWLDDLNLNKANYFIECEKLKDVVNTQKWVIAKLENELNVKTKTINYLSHQLMEKDLNINNNNSIDLISFD
jgi:hypothetical protein